MKRATVLAVVREFPGSTGSQIMAVLCARSRAAKYFGEASIWSTLFGPSYGGMYIALAELERRHEISSHWGVATEERGWQKPRHYWPSKEQAP